MDKGVDRLRLACIITRKMYMRGKRVLIHACSKENIELMDELLWTFDADSFVPHCKGSECDVERTPVIIGDAETFPNEADTLINLEDTTPLVFTRFENLVELVGPDEKSKELGREKFRFFRDRGYPLKTHEIN